MLKRIVTLLAACAALTLPASTGRAQQGMDDMVQLEVLDGGPTGRGTYLTALRLTLSDGWKTYWRAPGETGIPPSFDWRGSRNVGAVSIAWPTPQLFDANGLQTIGYKHQLVLPVEVTPSRDGQPVRLRGRIEIGLCGDICVPGTLQVDHQVNQQAGRNPAIAAALAQRPYSAAEAGVRAATCHLTPTEDGIRIEARITMPTAGGREVAVIEPGNPRIWVSETETVRQGDTLLAASEMVSDDGGAFALDRSQIRITVLGQRHAVDIQGCSGG